MSLTKEQLEFRRTHIGASDAPIIMGETTYKTRYQLWQEKRTGIFSEGNANTEYGNKMEPVILDMINERYKFNLIPKQIESSHNTWMFATFDGVDEVLNIHAEIKCNNAENHTLAKQGFIPRIHFPQQQHQLLCNSKEWQYYFSYHKKDLQDVFSLRNIDYMLELLDTEREFYEKHMVEGIPPEKVQKDFEDEEKKHKVASCTEWDLVASKYIQAAEACETWLDEKDKWKEKLIALSDNKNCEGAGIKLTKSIKPGAVDYDKIPELQGIDKDQYRKTPVESWRINIIK